MNRLLTLYILLLAWSIPGYLAAQSTGARIQGTVVDASGAVVTGADVVAGNTATMWTTTTSTNQAGQFFLYPLPPGTYRIDFQKSGFQAVHVDQLQLYTDDTIVRNVTLEVGSIAQAVTVTATAAVLNQSPSVENIVTEDQVETLPLNGRDYNQLVFLGAGAVDFSVSGTNYGLGSAAVNGNQSYSNGYSLDGVSNNYSWQNTSGIGLSVDLIREFKVVSGVAPAEYGQGGTNVIVISKSGTNRFHGSLFEYHRGNTFIARVPFSTGPPAPFARDQFGGSLGGPVRMPGYDGHNRTFFFFNYEGLRQSGDDTRVATVPPDAFWKGDFSSLLPAIQLRDPLIPGRPVIPGNRLDLYLGGARIDATALKLRSLFPSPTIPGLFNNSVIPVDTTSANNQFTVKGDRLLRRNQSLSARVTSSRGNNYTPGSMGMPDMGHGQQSPQTNAMLSWTAPLAPSTVNEFRLGVSMIAANYSYRNDGYPNADTVGIQGLVPATSAMVPPLPSITFSGTDAFTSLNYWQSSNLGENISLVQNNSFTLAEVVSTVRGGHQLKAGFSGIQTLTNYLYENNGNGTLTFNGANAARSTGYSFADFLIGVPSASQQTPLQAKVLLSQPEYAFFAQDDWRIWRNFTLTAGIRNEMFYHPAEDQNRLAMFSPELQGGGIVVACSNGQLPTNEFLPEVAAKITNAQGHYIFPIACGSSLGYDPTRLVKNMLQNWAPRVGVAWDPAGDGKWLVRSGYGIFYNRLPQQNLALTVGSNPPFAGLFNYSQSVTNGVPSFTLQNPYPATGTPNITPYGIEKDFRMPSNQQWNLTVEHTLGSNTLLSLKYVGNKGTHLFRDVNANTQQVDPATGKIYRLYQSTFGTAAINYEMANADSIYNSAQMEARRRFSHGLAYQVNWTWAKGLDDVGQSPTAAVLDTENLGRDRANSNYVRRHQVNSNFTWELPLGRGKRLGAGLPAWLDAGVGGWRLSGIWRYTTGRYLTPTFTNSGAFSADNRPDVVYGVSPNLPRSERSPDHWFNPAAFAIPPATDSVTGLPRYGDAGRNIVIGPGLNDFDGSLSKMFPVGGEGRRTVLRMDMFNLLNHPNWINPDMNISDVNLVGKISGIQGTMRQAQFALEFQF